MISDEIISEIRAKTDVVDLIGEYIPLIKKGKNFFGVCPFHDDHSPSMSVSPEKQIYTCFTCGASGNVYRFLMDYENISFVEAVKTLSVKTGVQLGINIKTENKQLKTKDYEILDLSSKYFQNNLNSKEGIAPLEYLKNRDLFEKTINEFRIGVSLKINDGLLKVLKSKKFDGNNLINLGLINSNDQIGESDVFRSRIMFPIQDQKGNVIGFSGRTYIKDDKMAKYINSKETPIFKKGELLYNYHRAKNEARRKGKIILMEGQMDVIRSYSMGILNVVSGMGTALTHNQALLLKKLAKEIVICFDGDEAGKKAVLRANTELKKIDVEAKVVSLDNIDPDEYLLENGADKFLELVDEAISMMDFKIKALKENVDFSKPNEITNYVNLVIKELNELEDPVLVHLYLDKLAEGTNLDKELLLEKTKIRAPASKKIIKIKITNKKNTIYEKAELGLLYFMLKNKEIINKYENNVIFLPTSTCRALANELIYYAKGKDVIETADFITFLDDKKELIQLVGKITAQTFEAENETDSVEDYFIVLKKYNIGREVKRVQEQMTEEPIATKKAELAEKIRKLKLEELNNVKRN